MTDRKMILSDTIKPLLGGVLFCALPTVFLLVTLCGCSDSRRHISGTFVDEGDELIHICPDRDFVMIVPDFDVITGVSELLNDTALALYTMIDDDEPLVVDTFIVRYREDNKCDLIAPRTHECFKGL